MKNPWPYDGPYRLLRAFGVAGRFWIALAVSRVIGWPGSLIELIIIMLVVSFLLVSAMVESWRMISTSSAATVGTVFAYGLGVAIHLYMFLYELDNPVVSPAAILAGVGLISLGILLIIELLSVLSMQRTSERTRPSDGSRV